ncbi:LysE family translocator [uncultured Cohaesibacter sp.]|uniref:LysE family translocator n=1 Tax=uncultured Cohaesibacter sp. TaxID=1002546 RepID=UPI00292F1417|nr:LysE family translocator [uncultured Cohaesibacter sp.]
MLFSLDTLSLFVATSVLLGIAPGPDNIFILTQSALMGRKSGIMVTLGVCTGILVHTVLVSIGIAVLFQTSEVAFTALKFAGALYLVYLAWQAFRAGGSNLRSGGEEHKGPGMFHLYARGIVMNVSNPKVAIFFLAFLPQFTDPSAGSITLQLMSLGVIFDLVTFLIFVFLSFSAAWLGGWLRRSERAQIVMHRIAGVIFLGLAARLLTIKFSNT